MAQATKISPFVAILICLNSMIGAGLFINTNPLTQLAGAFGFLGYIIAVLILLPLIICIAELASLHPVAGGLYVYSREHVSPMAGFLSSWTYFVGKTTSVAILVHKFIQFFQARITILQSIPILLIDFALIFFLVGINCRGVSVGGRIQYFFTTLKAIPIFFTFCAGFVYFDAKNFADILDLQGVLYTIPIAIFPLLGFEVICAIGNMIQDAKHNIKRVIMTAFGLVALINIGFQVVIFGIHGQTLGAMNEPVLMLGFKALSNYPWLASAINGAVFASIIGACFSILTSNCWNLHTIARYNHLPAASLLTRVNRYNVPWISLLIEASLGCLMLIITTDQVPLQNMSVFAQIISYLLSALAAWYAVKKGAITNLAWWIPCLAIGSCLIVTTICLQRIFTFGISSPFLIILALGWLAMMSKRLAQKPNH